MRLCSIHSFLLSLSEDEDGLVHVGKIMFDPKEILGRGCEGTTVFKYVLFLL